jgi:hypothetical protein
MPRRIAQACGLDLLGPRRLTRPPFWPARRASSLVNWWPLPLSWEAVPPLRAISSCLSGSIAANPRRERPGTTRRAGRMARFELVTGGVEEVDMNSGKGIVTLSILQFYASGYFIARLGV